MRIFGFEISRRKEKAGSAVDTRGNGGWFNIIREGFSGAWQRNIVVDAPKDILAFSAVFSCVTMIAGDIGKLRIKLVKDDSNGICTEIKTGSPFLKVLAKPNRYQTRIKFIEQWIVSKLLWGNAYALKDRDQRGVVRALYMLDPQRVTPLVTEDGGVFYRLAKDYLSNVPQAIEVPASEIIHDRMICLWHPLVGVSPIYACGLSATMGNRIQANSTTFFQNMSRPSGQLTSPTTISDETAARLKATFEENFGGGKLGRLMVAGDGLKYEAMTIPAEAAQLIEQLKWTVEDVARCFHVPMYKLGGPLPVRASVESDQLTYFSDCLQTLIESGEASLDEGLELPSGLCTEFDLDGLLRMDQAAQVVALSESVKGSIRSPNEARAKLNLAPVKGGESPLAQQQNFSLAALAKRDAKADPFATGAPALPAPASKPDNAANDEQAAQEAYALLDYISKGLACTT